VTFTQVIRRVQKRLQGDAAGRFGLSADASMEATQRELALFAANMIGAQRYVGQFSGGRAGRLDSAAERRLFRDMIEQSTEPHLVIDPGAGLHIIDINDAYAAATLTERARAVGARLFDVFPDNPGDPGANGVSNLYESIRTVAQSGRSHRLGVQRYDIRDPSGRFVTRYWRPINFPVFDDSGRLRYIVHRVSSLPADFDPGARS
jgi:PAS domain-containing protein